MTIRERFSNSEIIGQDDLNKHYNHHHNNNQDIIFTDLKSNNIFFDRNKNKNTNIIPFNNNINYNVDGYKVNEDSLEGDLSKFKKGTHVCRIGEKEREVYGSEGSVVEIVVPKTPSSFVLQFLFHFQGVPLKLNQFQARHFQNT